MAILGTDISHFQSNPNFGQMKASGREFVVLKATESTNYADPTMAANRRNAHAAGLIVGLYHFSRAGNAAAEAAWFLKNVGTLQAGEFLVLDWEVPAPDPVGWCKAWLDAVQAATGRKAFIYMNQSAMNASNWGLVVAADHALWLAKYDNSTSPTTTKWWPAAAMKQFSDKGTVPGISGAVDVDVFYGTRDQLLAYCAGGATPTQGDDDMNAAQEGVLQGILNWIVDPNVGIIKQLGDVRRTLGMDDPDKNGQDRLGDLWEQADRNTTALLAAVGGGTGKVDAAAIAAAIPDDIAKQVADELIGRLKS